MDSASKLLPYALTDILVLFSASHFANEQAIIYSKGISYVTI